MTDHGGSDPGGIVGGPVRIADGGGSAVACGTDGRWAVATTTDVTVYDDRDTVASLTPPGQVTGLSFAADGRVLTAGAHRYDLAAGQWLPDVALDVGAPTSAGDQVVRATCWDPDARTMAAATEFRRSRTASGGGTKPSGLVVRAGDEGTPVSTELEATAVAFTGDGRVLAAGQELAVLDGDGSVITRVALEGGSVRTLASRGDLVVAATRGGHLAVVELGAGGTARLRAAWHAHDESAIGAGWLDGDLVASVGWAGEVRVWDRTGRQVAASGDPAADEASPATAFTTDGGGRLLVVRGGPDAGVLQYDVN